MGIGSMVGGAAGKGASFAIGVAGDIVKGAAGFIDGIARMMDGGAPNPMTSGFKEAVDSTVNTVGGALSSGSAQAGGMAGDAIDKGLAALGTFPSPTTPSTGPQASQGIDH